nr:hypothetical protein [Tanacetum cinerariifolium]
PSGEALRKCILSGPYKPKTVLVQAVEATDDSSAVPEHTTVETQTNMSPEKKDHFLAEKESIHLILTGIGDEIYSTVDACQTAQDIWEAIERLQQGESLNIQDVKTNLFWEFGKFTSHDGETMESYYTRFYKLMNEMIRNNLTVTTMQRTVNVVGARENVGSPVVQHSGIQCFNCREFRHFAKECKKPKRVKDSAYHKEKMLLYKQAEQVKCITTSWKLVQGIVPPMLATRRYPQWRSRFLRYIDTRPNGEALRKCILSGPCNLLLS